LSSNPWSFSELGQDEAHVAMALPGKDSNKNLPLVISHKKKEIMQIYLLVSKRR